MEPEKCPYCGAAQTTGGYTCMGVHPLRPSPAPSDRERAESYLFKFCRGYAHTVHPLYKERDSKDLAALLAEVRAEERERIESILKVLSDDLDIGEQYDKPGGMKPTRHPALSRMLPTHRNHIRRLLAAIRKGEP